MTKLSEISSAKRTEHMENALAYNEAVRGAWINIWVRNAARNYGYIEKLMEEKDVDILALPKQYGKPVLILASGPSLDDVAPHIKQWEGDVWCSTSQLSWCEHHGIDPSVCVYIDADPSQGFLITDKFRKGGDTSCTMITHPSMPREILEQWGGDTYFFRMHDPGDEFSTKYLPAMYGGVNPEKKRFLKSHVLNAGCVANAMVALAQAFGHSPIFLCGYDLGYPDGIKRFRNYYREGGKWIDDQPMLPPDRPVFPGNNGITTDELSCFYKYSFMIMWGLGCPPVISCSRGIISEIPHADPAVVVERQGKGFEDLIAVPMDAYRRAQTYLKYRGIHIVRGRSRVETANEVGRGWLGRILMRYRFWKMDDFSRMMERGGPSLVARVKALMKKGGPYVLSKDGSARRWFGGESSEQEGGGEGGERDRPPELPLPPGDPKAAAIREHTA